jgi:periplasmic divalent cation tolerance protein
MVRKTDMKPNFVELVVTCGSWQEAQRIADSLLEKKLVACVEFMDIKSKFHWEGHINETKEIKLIMETIADHFEKVEEEVAKLHSYETFVLQQIPITKLSAKAATWLTEETK